MNFGNAIRCGFARYADFYGRSVRSEYWWWILFVIVVRYGLVIMALMADRSLLAVLLWGLLALFALGTVVPTYAVGARRLHDLDKSGWLLLLGFIPVLNILLIVWLCGKGTAGPNAFGPDPLSAPAAEVFS